MIGSDRLSTYDCDEKFHALLVFSPFSKKRQALTLTLHLLQRLNPLWVGSIEVDSMNYIVPKCVWQHNYVSIIY
jgi:hypothetical protein